MHPPLLVISVGDLPSPSQSSFKKSVSAVGKGSPTDACGQNTGDGERRRVSFLKRVTIKKIRSHKLYSVAEREFTWHSEEEYLAIKKGCIRTLRQMMSPGFQEDDEFCPRGLEVRTKEAATARKEIRAMATLMVLDEQELQTEWGEKNDDRIREVYVGLSQEAHYRAHFRGLGDENVAKNSYSSGQTC